MKIDRKGQNNKELTVRRGELIEIEDNAKKWWRARNFQGDVGHVPNNILEEVEIEHRPTVNIDPRWCTSLISFAFLFFSPEGFVDKPSRYQCKSAAVEYEQSFAL